MRRKAVERAVDEARRFIVAAESLLTEDAAVRAREVKRKREGGHGWESGPLWGSKLSGNVRRASMDLTRALAEMRKP